MRDEPLRGRIARGVAASDQEDFEAALSLFDSVVASRPGFPDVHNRRGVCLAMLDRPDEALEAFEEAVRMAPGYAEAHLNRGILLQELGRHDAARVALGQASHLEDRHGGDFPSAAGNEIALGHARVGDLYLVAGHPAEAAREYERALEVRPGYLDIRTRWAEALLALGEVERATEQLRTVLDQNEWFTAARLRYGVALRRAGRMDAAVAAWRRCLEEAPDDHRARAYLASAGVRPERQPPDPG
jgi:tetratricopeptide (TPR) repeat protein